MKFLVKLFVVLCIVVIAYVVWALSSETTTTNITIKLIGPGKDPVTCARRAEPDFKLVEPYMSDIATAILESDEIHTVESFIYAGSEDTFLVMGDMGTRDPTDAEKAVYLPRLKALSENALGGFSFDEFDGKVRTLTTAACGLSTMDWVYVKTIGYVSGNVDWSRFSTGSALLYWPDGVPDVMEPCTDEYLDPDPIYYCEVRMNDNWTLGNRWMDHEQIEKEALMSSDSDQSSEEVENTP